MRNITKIILIKTSGTLKKYYNDVDVEDTNTDTPPLSPPPTPTLTPQSLGSIHKSTVSVRLLSGDEATERFFKVAEDVQNEEFSSHTQRITFTNSLMKRWYKHDDPELIVVHHLQPSFISKCLQVKGFPPWQLRVGEIYQEKYRLPFSRGALSEDVLTRALYSYGKVEQRLGK